MDEFVRAVEATIFASAEPLGVEDIQGHAGDVNQVVRALRRMHPEFPKADPGMLAWRDRID